MAQNVYTDIPSDRMGGNKQTLQSARDCSICCNAMTSEDSRIPRLLTCGHTFCTQCIRSIYTTSESSYFYTREMDRGIHCPHCKAPCKIPNEDVTKLPKNYILLDIISEQPSLPRIQLNPETIECNIHNIIKKSYCFNCQKLVCPYCQMSNHQTHNCEITVEAIKAFLPDFKLHQERLESFSQQLTAAKERFETTINRLKDNHKEGSHNINVRFTAITEEATKWKNINIRKLDDILKEREDILDQQVDSISAVIKETNGKLELAKHITSPQNEEQFFMHYKEIGDDTKDIMSRELGLYPLVHDHIEWRVDPINHIMEKMNTIAFVNEEQSAGLATDPATSQSHHVYPDDSTAQPISVSIASEDHKPVIQPIATTRVKTEETRLPEARSVLYNTHSALPPPRFPGTSVTSRQSSSLPQISSHYAPSVPNAAHGHTGRHNLNNAIHGNVHNPT